MAVTRMAIIASAALLLLIVLIFNLPISVSETPTIHLPQVQPKLAAEISQTENPVESNGHEIKEGYIGPAQGILLNSTKTHTQQLAPLPSTSKVSTHIPTPSPSSLPILALLYTGAGGPKKCRGTLLTAVSLPRPASQHKAGACYDLPENARCGLFVSEKDDHCEAKLFSNPGCLDTDQSYVNTVVFMPELRPVGALWRSMEIRCGVDVPEVLPINPSAFGNVVTHENGH